MPLWAGASGVKRKANAMSEGESKARKAAHKVEVRAQQKAAREAAAAAAANARRVTLQQLNELLEEAYLDEHPDSPDDWNPIEQSDWEALLAWVARQEDADEFDINSCVQFYDAWCEEMRYAPPPPILPLPPTGNFSLPPLRAQPLSATTGPPPADPDDGDPWSGGSADMFYFGPGDHDTAERYEQQERVRRSQPGFVQLTLSLSAGLVEVCLRMVKEDHLDGYEIEQERWYNDDARRSAFYGVPAGDLPPGSAAPFGWVPPSGVVEAEPPPIPRPFREDVARYGPVANNPKGDQLFRKDRAVWYESITHEPLTGTPTEQWAKADRLARSFRMDNTRSGRPGPSSDY